MAHRKQSNRDMLVKHRQEYQQNLNTIARLTARNEALTPIITEEENVEIIAMVRSTRMTLESLQHLLERCRNGDFPFPTNNSEEDMTHEDE